MAKDTKQSMKAMAAPDIPNNKQLAAASAAKKPRPKQAWKKTGFITFRIS